MDEFVGSSLIKLYVKNDYLDDACWLFGKMPHKDCVLWNVMLHGFVKCGQPGRAIKAFEDMRNCEIKPDNFCCCSFGLCFTCNQLHGLVISCGFQLNPLVPNTLVAMYSKFGQLSDACKLCSTMPETSVVTWNGMIAGYVHKGFMDEARHLFSKMISSGVRPNSITFVSLLPSVSESESFMQSKEIHGYILRHGVSLDLFLNSYILQLQECKDGMRDFMSKHNYGCYNVHNYDFWVEMFIALVMRAMDSDVNLKQVYAFSMRILQVLLWGIS
ncbi:Tetratricopeptide repeat (TPR)-like superfamily protein [Euphorbia peplus]|nr:Tetratricopeptide repeat (TPR)-like superfamily protein [Euphorbia peplus]